MQLKRFFVFLLFSLLPFYFYAQDSYVIKDSETKAAVSYAYITILSQHKVLIADYDGKFKLNEKLNSNDTLVLSCIGYEKKRIAYKDLTTVVELKPKVQQIKEVNIFPKKVRILHKRLGITRRPTRTFLSDYVTAKNGNEKAYWIPNEYSIAGKLKSVNVYVSKVGYPDADFRLHIYACDPLETKPAKELTTTNIISTGSNGNEWRNIDLRKKNIQIPVNGCFIGIEWFDSPKAKYYEDTLSIKGKTYHSSRKKDTLYQFISKGNGVAIGTRDIKYKYAKNRFWYRSSADGSWIQYLKRDESKLNQPETMPSGRIFTITENNLYYPVPCINIEADFPKEKLEANYQAPKKRKLRKVAIDKKIIRRPLFKYPQATIDELIGSLIKAFEADDIIYAFTYLCVYQDGELEELIDDLQSNENSEGKFFSAKEKEKTIAYLKKIQANMDPSDLSKLNAHEYVLKTGEEESYHLVVEDGKWRINPNSYRIVRNSDY